MNISTLQVGQLQTNCYLLEEKGECLIIDPGDDPDLITQTLQDKKLKPIALLASHGHFDHLMAAFELQQNFNIPFYIHQKDRFLLDRLQETARHFLGQNVIAIPPKKISFFSTMKQCNNETMKIRNFNFEIIPTPGHTPGSVSFYFKSDRHPEISQFDHKLGNEGSNQNIEKHFLFDGDLIFANGGYGRTDFSYCSFSDLQKSIQKILKLPSETIIYSGHGEITTVKKEKPFYI